MMHLDEFHNLYPFIENKICDSAYDSLKYQHYLKVNYLHQNIKET